MFCEDDDSDLEEKRKKIAEKVEEEGSGSDAETVKKASINTWKALMNSIKEDEPSKHEEEREFTWELGMIVSLQQSCY